MKHQIDIDRQGPLGGMMAEAIQTCVHCGFCLPACPTYRILGQEMDSPRGRIVLMKEVLEGQLPIADAGPHLDACLGCLACEPACPSGVRYRELISPFRSTRQSRRSVGQRIRCWLVSRSLPFPGRFRFAARAAGWLKPIAGRLPETMRPMLELLPHALPPRQQLPNLVAAQGERRARVALLAGCAQQVLEPDINAATIDVLTRNGVEVLIPAGQSCCGALSWHVGNLKQAQQFARRNLAAFPDDVDAVISNAAGCGSGMREYGAMLKGTDQEPAAEQFSQRILDVSEFLDRLGDMAPIPDLGKPLRVAYQEACHLVNGQQVAAAPRRILQRVPGLQLVPLADNSICCGSAGTYNLDQPEIAWQLGAEKATRIVAADPDLVASGNIGCIMQLRRHLAAKHSNLPVRHTMQILRDAYVATDGQSSPAHQ